MQSQDSAVMHSDRVTMDEAYRDEAVMEEEYSAYSDLTSSLATPSPFEQSSVVDAIFQEEQSGSEQQQMLNRPKRKHLTVQTSSASIKQHSGLLTPSVAANQSTPHTSQTAERPTQDSCDDVVSEHQWRPLSGALSVKSHSKTQHISSKHAVRDDDSQHDTAPRSIVDSDTLSHVNNQIPRTVTTPESTTSASASSQSTAGLSARLSATNMFASSHGNEFAFLHPASLTPQNLNNASPADSPSIRRSRRKRASSVLEKYQKDLNLIFQKAPEEKSSSELIKEAKKLRQIIGEQEQKISNLKKSSQRLTNALEMWINHAKDKDNHLISTLKEGENKMNQLTQHVHRLREQRNRIERKLAEEKKIKSKNTYIATNFDISRVKGNTTSYLCVNMYTGYSDKTVLYDKKFTDKLLRRIKDYIHLFQPPTESKITQEVLTEEDLNEVLLMQYTEREERPQRTIVQQENDLKAAVKSLLKKLKAHEDAYHLRQKIFLQNQDKARTTIEQLQKEYKLKIETQKEVEELEFVLKETRNATEAMACKHLTDMEKLEEELNAAKSQYEQAIIKSNVMKERIEYYKSIAESRPKASIEDAPSGRIAICFTDIEGSSRLWMEDPKSMQQAMNLHNMLLKSLVDKIGPGLVVKTEGDGWFIVWQKCEDALAFALEAQLRLNQVDWPEGLFNSRFQNPSVQEVVDEESGKILFRGLRVRIGIHFADASPTLDEVTGMVDYYGASVSRAARVCSLAKGGQIILSNDAYMEVKSLIDGSFGIPVWSERKGTAKLRGMESEPDILWLVLPKELSKREISSDMKVDYSKEEHFRLELRKLEKRYNQKCAQVVKIQASAAAKYNQLDKAYKKTRKQVRELLKQLNDRREGPRKDEPRSNSPTKSPAKSQVKSPQKRTAKRNTGKKSPIVERTSSWNEDSDGPRRRQEIGQRVDNAIDRLDHLSNQVKLTLQKQDEQQKAKVVDHKVDTHSASSSDDSVSTPREAVEDSSRKSSLGRPSQSHVNHITMGMDDVPYAVIGRNTGQHVELPHRRSSKEHSARKSKNSGLNGLLSLSSHQDHRIDQHDYNVASPTKQYLEARHDNRFEQQSYTDASQHSPSFDAISDTDLHDTDDQLFVDIPEEIDQQVEQSTAYTLQQLEEVLKSLSGDAHREKEQKEQRIERGQQNSEHDNEEPALGANTAEGITSTPTQGSDAVDSTASPTTAPCSKTTQTNEHSLSGINAEQYETLEKVRTLLQKYQSENVHLHKKLHIVQNRLENANDHIASLGKLTKLWNSSEISLRAVMRREHLTINRSSHQQQQRARREGGAITINNVGGKALPSITKGHSFGRKQDKIVEPTQEGSKHRSIGALYDQHSHSGPVPRRDVSPIRRVELITNNVMQPQYEDRTVQSPQTPQFLHIVTKPPTTASNTAMRRGSGSFMVLDGLKPVLL